MTAKELKAAQLHPRDSNAIRPLDPDAVGRLFSWDRDFHTVLDPGGFADPEEAALVDAAAVPLALEIIRRRYPGALVEVQDHGNPGFDFLVTGDELKSTRNHAAGFFMSEYQRRFSRENAGRYSLLVLTDLDMGAGTCASLWFDGAVDEHFAFWPIEWRARQR